MSAHGSSGSAPFAPVSAGLLGLALVLVAVMLAALPLFHSFGQTVIQNGSIAIGGTFTLQVRFSPEEAFEIMARDQVTAFAGVPTMYFALLHHESEKEQDLSTLKFCMSGGAPMPVEVMKAFEKKYSVEILEGYGLSETSPVSSFNMMGRPRKAGSIGYPVWGVEMQIVDLEDRPLPDGEPGEICIRGHNIMKGYLNRPEETTEAITDGWFHTGDVARIDEDGFLYIVDRIKDMVLRGGENIYCSEVEATLFDHPDVTECAVFGVPDERLGEEVGVAVVARAGASLDAEALRAHCRDRIAKHKIPKYVWLLSEPLPRNANGKFLKRQLRDELDPATAS